MIFRIGRGEYQVVLFPGAGSSRGGIGRAYRESGRPSGVLFSWRTGSGGRFRRVYHKIPEENVAEANVYTLGAANELYPMFESGAYIGTSLPLSSDGSMFSNGFNGYADAGKDRLSLIEPRPDDPEKGMLASVTSNFSSGWMPGDIKGAYLSSADDTDLVESNHFNEDFLSAGDWVLGDKATITAGALVYAGGSGATDSYVSGGFPTNAQCAVTYSIGRGAKTRFPALKHQLLRVC